MNLSKKSIEYDFDVHKKGSFMYFWTKNYMDATLDAALESNFAWKNKTVLDIGIGRGRSLTIFKKLDIGSVHGIDISKSESSYAHKQSKRLGLPLKVTIDDFDNTFLKSISAESYDVVALMNILFCVPNERVRKTIITEAKRILKPGGRLIILDMQKPALMWIMSKITLKPWEFRTNDQLLRLFSPLICLSAKGSNFFYFINRPMDIVSKVLGTGILNVLDALYRLLGIPASTKTLIFTK